jgi:nucleoside-diphosphate-sugar epimerase
LRRKAERALQVGKMAGRMTSGPAGTSRLRERPNENNNGRVVFFGKWSMASPAANTAELDDVLSEPTAGVLQFLRQTPGDFLVLGAGGKMGLHLAAMLRRGLDVVDPGRRVVAASRFSSEDQHREFAQRRIETQRCDVLNPADLAKLPDIANVFVMIGTKFGTSGQEGRTWATNCFVPGLICQRFPKSRIAAFSTGNVYGLTEVARGGSVETDRLAPVGEYAMTALGRERMYEYFSQALAIPITLIRLNYSCELRYGVLVDIAQQVLAGEPVDVSMGSFNVIWQRDACAMSIQSLALASSPARPFNVSGPEILGVREVARAFGERMKKPVTFVGQEAPTALLNNAALAFGMYGKPGATAEQMIDWISEWLLAGRPTLGKPTHFSSRSGDF